ncbi:MAG: hypothetical protein DRJ13_12620 [Bacteroidetes bacterium]|nr:MAG: hypothetical protein DRJ13_12620 [Bacteroidota bacterium]
MRHRKKIAVMTIGEIIVITNLKLKCLIKTPAIRGKRAVVRLKVPTIPTSAITRIYIPISRNGFFSRPARKKPCKQQLRDHRQADGNCRDYSHMNAGAPDFQYK